MTEKVLAWHFLNTDRRTGFGENILVRKGQTLKLDAAPMGGIGIGKYGYHASIEPIDAFSFMRGTVVERVEMSGHMIINTSLICATERTCLGIADAKDAIYEFIVWCVEQIPENNSQKTIKQTLVDLQRKDTTHYPEDVMNIFCEALDAIADTAAVGLKTVHDSASEIYNDLEVEYAKAKKRYDWLYDEFVASGSAEEIGFKIDAAYALKEAIGEEYYDAQQTVVVARNRYYDALREAKADTTYMFNRKLESLLLDLVN